MNWPLREKIQRLGRAGATVFGLPRVVLEIEPGFVAGIRLEGSSPSLRAIAVRALESPALDPQVGRPNVTQGENLRHAIQETASALGDGNGRLGLLLPDGVVRVAILSFETLPERQAELKALVRWRMKDLLSFPPEEARVSWQVLRRTTEQVELLAMAAKTSVLVEYEAAVEHLNGGPELILPATAALLPLLPEALEGGAAAHLLLHVCCGWMTAVLLEGARVLNWRNRPLTQVDEAGREAEIAREAVRVAASARDHHRVEIRKVWLCSRPAATEGLATRITRATGQPVEVITPDPALATTLVGSERRLYEQYGATIAGLVANSR